MENYIHMYILWVCFMLLYLPYMCAELVFRIERIMFKRPAEGEAGGGEPPAKKIVFQPLQLGAITNLEELDLKTLQFQNR